MLLKELEEGLRDYPLFTLRELMGYRSDKLLKRKLRNLFNSKDIIQFLDSSDSDAHYTNIEFFELLSQILGKHKEAIKVIKSYEDIKRNERVKSYSDIKRRESDKNLRFMIEKGLKFIKVA